MNINGTRLENLRRGRENWLRMACMVLFLIMVLMQTPLHAQGAWTGEIGTGSQQQSTVPIYTWYTEYPYTQQLYKQEELYAAGLRSNKTITKISFHYLGMEHLSVLVDIYMVLVPADHDDLSNGYYTAGLRQVAQSYNLDLRNPLSRPDGVWVEIPLDTPFSWDGVSNIAVSIQQLNVSDRLECKFFCSSAPSMAVTSLNDDATVPLRLTNVPQISSSDVTTVVRDYRPDIKFYQENCTARSETFAFSPNTYEIDPGETFISPTPAGAPAGTQFYYAASNPYVATVNSTSGQLSFTGAVGIDSITAEWPASGGKCAKFASYKLNVKDNCNAVGEGSGTNNRAPIVTDYNYSWNQMIYKGSDIGVSCRIHSISFQAAHANAATRNVSIFLAQTTKTKFENNEDFVPIDELTLVYNGPWKIEAGWNRLEFNEVESFSFDAGQNLVVAIYSELRFANSIVTPSPFLWDETAEDRTISAFTDNWREEPEPGYYDGHWGEYPLTGVRFVERVKGAPQIDICMYCCTLRPNAFTYDASEANHIVGTTFNAPVLTNTTGNTSVIYGSSDESVATVAADGTVTMSETNAGEAIISARIDAGGGFCTSSSQYIVRARKYVSLTYRTDGSTCGGDASTPPQREWGLGTVTLSSEVPTCSEDGKIFMQWNTAPDGSGDAYYPGSPFPLLKDTVLYAIYDKRCCIVDSALQLTYTRGGQTHTVERDADGYYNIDICHYIVDHETDFRAQVTSTTGCSLQSDAGWDFCYGSGETLRRVAGTTFTPPAPYNARFDTLTGFDLVFTATSSMGCELRLPARIRVSKGVFVTDFGNDPFKICPGSPTDVTIGYAKDQKDFVMVDREHPQTTSIQSVGDTVFLPDGYNCPGVGCKYESSVWFTDFQDGAKVRTADDILYLQMNIEHSYIGDLYISLKCPYDPVIGRRREVAILKKYNGGTATDCASSITSAMTGWASGGEIWTSNTSTNNSNKNNRRARLGVVWDPSSYNYSGVNLCDKTLPDNRPGTGWNYVWSNNDELGFEYAANDGYIYRKVNQHTPSGGTVNASVSADAIVDSSDLAHRRQIYHPDQSLAGLVGCPLNGDPSDPEQAWTITVIDGWKLDNGWIFNWSIAINEDQMRESWTYSVGLDSSWAECSWPSSSKYNDHFTVLAPDDFTGGIVPCNVHTIDNFGCERENLVDLDFIVKNIIVNTVDSNADCNGEHGYIEINVEDYHGDQMWYALDPVFNSGVHSVDSIASAEQGPWNSRRFRDVSDGPHTVMVMDNEGCIKTENVVIGMNQIAVSVTSRSNATCRTSADGSFTVAASLAQPIAGNVFTYNVTGLGSNNTGVFENVPAGTYTVVVSDSHNSCPVEELVVVIGITIPSPTLASDTLVQPIVSDCPLLTGGYALSADVEGAGPYTYAWRAGKDGSPVTITPGSTAGGHVTASIVSDGSCGTYFDTLIVTETVHHCVDTFTSSFITIATPPTIAVRSGLDADKDWGCGDGRFTPTAASFTVTDACNPSAVALVTAGPEVVNGCHHSNYWAAAYTNSCGVAAQGDTIRHAWLVTTKPTFDAMPVVTAVALGSDCKYTIPDLTDTVLSRTTGCENSSLRVLEQSPASLAEYLQRSDRNDTIDVTVIVRDTCDDTAHAHVQVVIPQNNLTITTNLSTTTNTIDTAACDGYSVATSVTVSNPSGSSHSVWSSTPAGFSITDPSYPLALNPDTNYHVVVTDANGCTASADVNIALNPDPVITPVTGYDELEQSICEGKAIDTIKVKIENAIYDPSSTIGNVEGVAVTVRHHDAALDTVIITGKPKTTGTYSLATISNQIPVCDAKSSEIKFNVTDTIEPVIVTAVGGANGRDTVCITSSTSLTDTVMTIRETAGEAGDSWSWTVDGGTIMSGADTREITVKWTASGDKTVTVTVTHGALNCTSVKSKVIHVQTVPTVDVSTVVGGGDEVTICPNRDTLSFNTTLGGADGTATYTYDYGGDLSFAEVVNDSRDTASIPAECGVDYRVGVTVTDNHGCSVTDSMTVHALDNTAPAFTLPGTWGTLVEETGCDLSVLGTAHPTVQTAAGLLDTLGVTVADGCTPLSQLTLTSRDSVMTAGVTCGNKIRRYYVVTDLCGNKDSIYEEIYVQFPSTKPTVDAIAAVTATPKTSDCTYLIPDLSGTVLSNAHGNCGDTYLRVIEQSPAALTEYLQREDRNDTIDVMVAVKDTCSDSAQVHVKVVIPRDTVHIMLPSLSLTTNRIDTSACVGEHVSVTATVTQPNGSEHVYWTSTPAGFTQTDPSYPLALGPDTTYQAVVIDNNGCTDTAKVKVDLNPSPVITPLTGYDELTQSICLGDSIDTIKVEVRYATYDVTSSIGTAERVMVVNIHHDEVGVYDTVLVLGNPKDTNEYWLRVLSDQSPACNKDSVKITFNVADTVKPVIETEVGGVTNKDTVCISSTTSLTNNEMTIRETAAMVGDSYAWTVDGGTITSGAGTREITVAWTSGGDKTVTVSVTRGACTSKATKQIYVQPVPTLTMDNAASADYDAGTDTYPICPNRDTLSFNTTLGGADGTATYNYTYGGEGVTFVQQAHDSRDTATIPHTCGVNYRVGVTVMDNHGCSVTDSMTISAIDTTAPTVTAAGGGKELDEVDIDGCTSDLTTLYPAVTTPTALHNDLGVVLDDNCIESAALIVDHRDSVFASVTCGYKIRRYYVVSDSCGNMDSVYQHINVHIAEHAFTISNVATSVDIGCVDSAVGLNYTNTRIVLPTVTDGCGHTISPETYTPTPVMTGRACMDTTTFTYTYRDCEGHDTTWTFTYNVTLRELSMNNPTELVDTLPCTNAALDAVSFNTPVGEMRDACGRLVTPIPVDENGDPIDDGLGGHLTTASPVIDVDGTGNGTVSYNWKYTDCSGREYIWRRKHVIKPDAFDGYPSDTVTVTCVGLIVEPTKPNEEVCGNAVTFDDYVRDSVASDRGCYMITYTSHYVVFAQDYYYTYAYIYNPPAFSIPANTENRTLQCMADTVAPGLSDLPTVRHSGCEGGIDEYVTPTGPVRTIKGDGCHDTVIYTYHYEDCAHSGDWSYIYYIVPTTAPHEVLNPETGTMASRSGDAQCFDSCYADTDTIWGATLPIIVSQCGDTLATPVPTYADTLTDASHDNVTGTRTYHYVYTDCTGSNTYEWTYRFDVSRHTNPYEVPQDPLDLTSLVDTVANVMCDSMAVRPTLPTVEDVCGNVLNPYADSSVVRTNNHCVDTVTYYYNYYDPSYVPGVDDPSNELAYHWYFRYYIDRTQMPDIVRNVTPNYDTVNCFADAVLPPEMPVVLDGCLDTLAPFDTIRDEHHDTRGGDELCTGSVKYTFKYKDCTGTNILEWEYTRYVVHPLLTPDVPDTVTEAYTCVNAAMSYEPHPDTLVNQCGDTILPVADPQNPIVNLVHDTGTVIYHYTYTDCDDSVYDWAYVCQVTPEEFHPPIDSTRTVNCVAQATVPTQSQYPVIDDCGVRIPQDRPWDSGEYPDTSYSSGYTDTCGVITYTYTYTMHGVQYTWDYVYTIDPPEFTIPTIDTIDTVECYDVHDPLMSPTLPVVINSCGDTINSSHTNPPSLVIDSSDYVAHGYCYGNIVYNYSYGDCSGDTLVWSFTHVVMPSTPPHEVENPISHRYAATSETVECFVDCDTICCGDLPVIVSVCGDTLTPMLITYEDTLADASHDTVTGTRTYHYIYRDCKDNEFDWVFVYTVTRDMNPFQQPEVGSSEVATEAYVNCDTLVVRPTMPRVVDVCGGVLAPYADSLIVRTDHNCKDTVTYYYNFYDPSYIPGVDDPADELVYRWTFTYYIDKALAPNVVRGFEPDHDTVACFADAVRPTQEPLVVDACGTPIVPVVDSVDTHTNDDPTNCNGKREYRYAYTDCSNTFHDTLRFTRYVVHPALDVPDSVTEEYVCVNAARSYVPHPDTLVNQCGDTILPVADPLNPIETLNSHDTGTVIYHYTYNDCDGAVYNWAYVCDVRPEVFQPPIDSTRTVNCLAQATVPTDGQYPNIDDCGVRIPFDRPWDSGEYPDTTYSAEFNDTCGVVTYTYTYTIRGEQYTWSYIYTLDPPEFTIPEVVTKDTVECYDVTDPGMTPTLPVVINSCGDTINSTSNNPPMLTIDSSDYVTHNRCHGDIVYHYTYTDCSGDTIVWNFTHVVHHTTIPHIVGVSPDTVRSVACFADALENFVVPEVEDVCGRTIERPEAVVTQGGTDCEGWKNYRYSFVDCDNVEFVWNFRYIVHDTVAPHIDVTALVGMGLTNSVAMGNCQYSMPDLTNATLDVTTDVASENCSNNVFFVEQTPPSTQRFHQPMNDSTVSVRLIVRDACQNRDTAYVDVVIPGSSITVDVVGMDDNGQMSQSASICLGESVTLVAQSTSFNGEQQYMWTPSSGLTINGSQAVASPAQTTTYTVNFIDGNGCTVSDNFVLTVHQSSATDVAASACDHFEWYGQSFDSSAESEYTLADRYGCDSVLYLHLTVNYTQATSYGDTICEGEEYHFFNQTLAASGSYDHTISSVNGCDSTITLYLFVVPRPPVSIDANYDCEMASYTLTAQTQATAFQWSSVPAMEELPEQATGRSITVYPTHHTLFTVLAGYEGMMQCAMRDTVSIDPVSVVDARMEVTPQAVYHEVLDWTATDLTETETWRQWYVDGFFYGDDKEITGRANEDNDSIVLVLIVGTEQCTDTARTVIPMLREGLFVPNVFTPDLKINRKFGAVGTGIVSFKMDIYNRTGALVFRTDDINEWWDGSHNGSPCITGSYVWRIIYSTEVYPDVTHEIVGQVILLR